MLFSQQTLLLLLYVAISSYKYILHYCKDGIFLLFFDIYIYTNFYIY